jgi:hypothetical protein
MTELKKNWINASLSVLIVTERNTSSYIINNIFMSQLLTRDEFREAVFKRDNYECIFCDMPVGDAHHIMERRLWPDGGYYLDNGASVCGYHHIQCEETLISVEQVREACGVKPILPPHLYPDQPYDKWGNPIVETPHNNSFRCRLKGELFFDPSVQKVLSYFINVEKIFLDYVKYPRTHHLPWSENINNDDRVIPHLRVMESEEVVVTEKMDGENTTMYPDHIHARSIFSGSHPSRDWVKNFWSKICGDIPQGWRVCGENVFAKHSIHYGNLPSYFMGFSIWNEKNICLSWDETLEWFQLLGIVPVPVLYRGIFNETKIKQLWNPCKHSSSEGYVVRLSKQLDYGTFRFAVGKFVRKDHIQTVKHWMHGQRLEKNILS